MDDNVMRVLQMLQDGKISAQEAETLIAALRGETAAPKKDESSKEDTEKDKENGSFFSAFENIKGPKIDLDDLGDRISRAVSKVQPEKILRRVQAQIRTVSRSSAHWSANVSARVRTWTDGEDVRPSNTGEQAEQVDVHEQEFHLEPDALVMVENPLGDIILTGGVEGAASIVARKTIWGVNPEALKSHSEQIEIAIHGTDSRLDIKVSVPEFFRSGTVDLELRVPDRVQARLSGRYGKIEIGSIEGRAEAVSTSGELHLHDLGGDARCESASGGIRLERIAGMATVATQSGDIEADDIRRGLSANTASGDVKAQNVEGGRVECKSVSGDVHAEKMGLQNPLDITVESISGNVDLTDASGNIGLKAVSGDVQAEKLTATRLQAQTVSGDVLISLREAFSGMMQLNTVSGDVSLAFPEGTNARVSMGTTSGELRCDHDAHEVSATETLWTGQIGTGAGTINIQTLSGDARLVRS